MRYSFSANEKNKLVEHYGQGFYDKVKIDIEYYAGKWSLEVLQLVDYFSVNCIFICRSEVFGNAILKIGKPCREVITEFNTLLEYKGRHFCEVFDADIDHGVILEEQIYPGVRLREEKVLDKRLSIFSSLYKQLHIEPANTEMYPTYTDWVTRITEYMSKREDYIELYAYMKKAKDICLSLNSKYTKRMLLHGDLHHDNILLNNNGAYKIIDPKGVIGDPIFDVPRFILNEQDDDKSSDENYLKTCRIIDYFEHSLHIPSKTLKQCFFIEMAMANCWNVESDEVPNLDSVAMAEALMHTPE